MHAELHYIDGGPKTVQYLLAVDTINFCFWPQPGLEYEHLARGFKVACLWLLLLVYLTSLLTSGQRLQSFADWLAQCRRMLCRQCWSDLAVHRWCLALAKVLQHDLRADAAGAAWGEQPFSAQSMGHALS